MKSFGRVLTAMVTPFHDDFSVDYTAAAELAKYLVAHGNDGLVVAGSTGEAATLSAEEKLRLFSTVLEAVGDKAVRASDPTHARAPVKGTRGRP